MNYWQVGSGQKGRRSYWAECLRFGMAFAGEKYWKNGIEKVEKDDLVVLRFGANKIVAVGKIVEHEGRVRGCATDEEKSWLKDFDGWDLSAYCYVEWRKPRDESEYACKQLPQRGFSRLEDAAYRRKAQKVFDQGRICDPSSLGGPTETGKIDDEKLKDFLRRELGEHCEPAFSEICSIRELAAKYYGKDEKSRHWDEFKEHEIRTFLVLPLLHALGWGREQIKIEINPRKLRAEKTGSIDVACFAESYVPGVAERNKRNCRIIIESKRFESGLSDEAFEQARDYADSLRSSSCNLVLTSNGYCYKAYSRDKEGEFPCTASAYLNLLNMRERYPLDPDRVDGALEVFRLLLPAHHTEEC